LSPEWTLIKAGETFYAEYHGMSGPEALNAGNDGAFLFDLI
jgi:hypothetical protein